MKAVEENRTGFKQTKIGWLPNDWEVIKIGDLFDIKAGGDVQKSRVSHEKNSEFKYPVYGNALKKKGLYGYTDEYKFEGPLITVTARGELGVAFSRHEKFFPIVRLLVLQPKRELDVKCYENIINTVNFHIESTGVPQLTAPQISTYHIPLLPYDEQQKIAEILSTWDTAITDTQNLIKQLKLRKKGLMQQLLTGKKRLTGFDGEWEVIRGNELFNNHSNKNHDGELEVLSATQDQGVIPRSETGIDIKYDPKSLKNYKKVEIGDFVISLRSFQGGIEYSRYEGIVSPAYTVLKESKPIAKDFYREYLKTTDFINKLNSIIYGIRDGKQISYKEFGTLKIHYPPIDEQNAIAKVIAIADEEIKSFANKLESLESQKKGLMQQLLTGQKRVTV
jgi:type I restriction enzyme S subunit